jgi:hypothetical protein
VYKVTNFHIHDGYFKTKGEYYDIAVCEIEGDDLFQYDFTAKFNFDPSSIQRYSQI